MVDVAFLEHLAEALCGVSAVLFTFIATLSRSEMAEEIAQNIIFFTLMLAAGVLWWLSYAGGVLLGLKLSSKAPCFVLRDSRGVGSNEHQRRKCVLRC